MGSTQNYYLCKKEDDCWLDNFCDFTGGETWITDHNWIVHADILNIRIPADESLPAKYEGPAFRTKFYEAFPGFTTDDTRPGLREDWYFIKDVGLVRIDQKWFSVPHNTLCTQDPDCLINEMMENPHLRLERAEYHCYDEGDVNHDCENDLQDISFIINNYGTQGYSTIDTNRDNKINLFDLVLVAKNMI